MDSIGEAFEIDMATVLGKGSYGRVYKARTSSGEDVAAKVIDSCSLPHDVILHEVQMLAWLSPRHEGIIDMKGIEVLEHEYRIYMELAYGDLLDYVSHCGALHEREAAGYFAEVASAVDYLHTQGVAHRDLKLENVLLDGAGRCKLCDFGLSHAYARSADGTLRRDELLMQQCGSTTYVAPEVLVGRGYDGLCADIWSLGICLFAMVSGFFPFGRASEADPLYAKARALMATHAPAAISGGGGGGPRVSLPGVAPLPGFCAVIFALSGRQCPLSAEAQGLLEMMLVLQPYGRCDARAALDAADAMLARGALLDAPASPTSVVPDVAAAPAHAAKQHAADDEHQQQQHEMQEEPRHGREARRARDGQGEHLSFGSSFGMSCPSYWLGMDLDDCWGGALAVGCVES